MASWIQQQLQQQLKAAEGLLEAVDRTVSQSSGPRREGSAASGSLSESGAPLGAAGGGRAERSTVLEIGALCQLGLQLCVRVLRSSSSALLSQRRPPRPPQL